MPDKDWEKEFINRWRTLFDYEARGLEACLNDSYHSKFAQALSELEVLLESVDEKVELKRFTGKLLEQLLKIAYLSPKLPREWLNFGDVEEELDADSFYLSHSTKDVLRQKLLAIFGTCINEVIVSNEPFAEHTQFFVDDLEEFYSDVIPGLHAWNLKTEAGISEACFFWYLSPWHWTGHLLRVIQVLNVINYRDREAAQTS